MEAFADHGEVEGDRVTGMADDAQQVLDRLGARSASTSPTCCWRSRPRASTSSRSPGTSWWRPSAARWSRPTHDLDQPAPGPARPAAAADRGPSGLVLFGVTGDLSRKKVMPAIYDLANRGLLPPGFSLVGFARRDWADQDFAQIVHDAVKEHARTEFREEVWQQLGRGSASSPAPSTTTTRSPGCDGPSPSSTRRAAPAATTPSTWPSRPGSSATSSGSCSSTAWPSRSRAPGAGSSSRSPSGTTSPRRRSSTRAGRGVPHRVGLPDRPLPRQGDGPEHPGDPVRQRDVRAALERPLRRPRPDHHGRGRRDRRASRLLRRHRCGPRRHPEPPAAADGPGGDGGARPRSRPTRCGSRSRSCWPASACPAGSTSPPPAASTPPAGPAAARSSGFHDEDGIAADSTTETFAAVTLHVENRRWAGVPFYLRTGKRLGRRVTEVAVVFKRAPHQPFSASVGRGAHPERVGDPDPARRGHDAAVRLQGPRAPRWRSATSTWTSSTAAPSPSPARRPTND